jgi:hypothetical protein
MNDTLPKGPAPSTRIKSIERATRDDIENLLDKYKAAVDTRVCREIDAGSCQTRSDYRRRDEAQDAEYKVRDEVIAELFKLIDQAITHQILGILT